jgi:hypothetical protein
MLMLLTEVFMSGLRRIGDLEIEEYIGFQRRDWAVRHIAWAILALVVLAALLGLFGNGILSKANLGDDEMPLQLEYERFGRYKAPMTLKARLGPEAVREGEARLWLERSYLNTMQVETIIPEPDSVESSADHLVYVFSTPSSNFPIEVTFFMQSENIGRQTGRVGLEGGPSLSFNQFIYP